LATEFQPWAMSTVEPSRYDLHQHVLNEVEGTGVIIAFIGRFLLN